MKKLTLGYQAPDYGSLEVAPEGGKSKQKMKEVFPSITISGDAARQLAAGKKAGDTFTGTVTFKIVEKVDRDSTRSKGGYGPYDSDCRLELEAMDINTKDINPQDVEDEENEDGLDAAFESYEKEQAGGDETEEEVIVDDEDEEEE